MPTLAKSQRLRISRYHSIWDTIGDLHENVHRENIELLTRILKHKYRRWKSIMTENKRDQNNLQPMALQGL